MNKPKVFRNTINKNIKNNEKVFYSKNKIEEEVIDNREPQEEVSSTSNTEVQQSVDAITMDDIDEDDLDDSDDSRYSDEIINSLAQVRDSLYPENRQRFNYLVNTGGIQIQC